MCMYVYIFFCLNEKIKQKIFLFMYRKIFNQIRAYTTMMLLLGSVNVEQVKDYSYCNRMLLVLNDGNVFDRIAVVLNDDVVVDDDRYRNPFQFHRHHRE